MPKLPDLEGLALFAKVAEARGFARAAADLTLSKATVSKAVTRLEERLGTRLFHRTSRALTLTDAGRNLLDGAAAMLSAAEAAESQALDQAASPRGLVRMAAPMSFGLAYLGPALPDFLAQYPEITLDMHLSDEVIDLIGLGFDLGIRIANLADSSLKARRLCDVPISLVGAPAYFESFSHPRHPRDLARHACLTYGNSPNPAVWRFVNAAGEEALAKPQSRFRTNNGEAFLPTLVAGQGLALLPDFITWHHLADGRLIRTMADWTVPPLGIHIVTPPGGHRPARVEALIEFLAKRFANPPWLGRSKKAA